MSLLLHTQKFINENSTCLKANIFRLILLVTFVYSCSVVGLFISIIGFLNCIFHGVRIKKLEKKIKFLEKKIKFLENYQIKNLNDSRENNTRVH
jgi:hypothetical protein